MSEANTPTANRTPFRRLGLARSIKRAGFADRAEALSTPKSALPSHAVDENVLVSSSPNPTANQMRPIKSTCSNDTSDQEDNVETPAPVTTPIAVRSSSKKTRLSLSQSWRKKIVQKKELQNIKRRKLMDEVEMCTEPEEIDSCVEQEPSHSRVETKSTEDKPYSKPPSNIKLQIQEVKESISVWRNGCIAALNDLQERRGTGDMESLLNMLQIPFDLVNFDSETQEFLDPD